MVVWRGETDAELGFIEELEALGLEPQLTVFNVEQDRKKLGKIIRGEFSENLEQYDYVYTFGTTVSSAIKTHLAGKKPHIFNIVSFPADVGIIKSEDGGQHNTAGVSSRVLTDTQISSAIKILPLTKVAVTFNPREANSIKQLEKMVGLGKKYSFKVLPIRIRPDENLYLSDLRKVSEIEDLSAVYFPSDSFLISHAKEIMSFVNSAGIPSICAVSTYIKHGCLIGTVADYKKLGGLAASIVEEHINGKALADLPVKFDHEPNPVINEETRAFLDLY